MTRKQAYRTSCAAVAIVAMLQNAAVAAEPTLGGFLFPAGATDSAGAMQYRDVGFTDNGSLQTKLKLLREQVKYVFVIFQENRSFDHYFGTYPGADGLFDARGKLITSNLGSTQAIRNTDGTYGTISPFLIPTTVNDGAVQIYPEATASVDHSHTGMVYSSHFKEWTLPSYSSTPPTESGKPHTAQNNAYALDEEGLAYADGTTSTIVSQSTGAAPTANPTLAQKQKAELALGHLDCNTIPFLWNYADRFTLFDNFHQTTIGPSTPNAIAMISGQTGETQWALHPSQGAFNSLPVTTDNAPWPGSASDTSAVKPAWGPDESPTGPNPILTYASLPLSFMGNKIGQITKADQNPAADLLDVKEDIAEIASSNPNVNWGWYQQGFGPESFDNTTQMGGGNYYSGCTSNYGGNIANPDACNWSPHASYIVHHNGPQYFGYLGDNTTEQGNMHGLTQFFSDISGKKLPKQGGVFYVRGGYANNDNLQPLVPNNTTTVHQKSYFVGNDDHPAYSDAMISEAQVADTVNAIANSPYWNQSAIIITYDETDGLYDHAPLNVRSWDPAGYPLAGGPRIPAIVISPFSAAHTISHAYSEHSSVIRFIDELFGLVPLADLPDEKKARTLGQTELGQSNLGPADDQVNPMGDLLEAFDIERLIGIAPPLPASYATIATSTVTTLPHYNRQGCAALKITPTDYPHGLNNPPSDPAPTDFNPRPSTAPGTPTSGTWSP